MPSLNKIFLSFLFIVSGLLSYAQYQVTATVIDSEGNPEEYATYRIFELPDTTNLFISNVTDSDGLINADLSKSANYRIIISAMMKLPITIDFTVCSEQPLVDLGIINTELAGQTLNEVTVIAQRPLVTKDIDRIGYDVQADADASTSNLRDILKKVPLVSVDADGNIKVNGSDNFNIYRNGRPNNGYTKNAKDIFAAIPASTIKKIEVITDPGAREDADSGGLILNIVTNSTVSMEGVTGSIGLRYPTKFGPQGNAFIMTQWKKLTLSASGGMFTFLWRNNFCEETSNIKFEETGNESESYSKYGIGNRGGWFNVECSLELDTLNLITSSVNGNLNTNQCNIYSNYSLLNSQGLLDYSYDSEARYRKYGYTDIDFNLDYQRLTRLKGEAITLSYRLSHTRQDQDQTTDYTITSGYPFDYTSNISDFDLKFFEHTFQLDWTRPLGNKFTIDMGAKYILRSSHSMNHQTLTEVTQTYDDFKHTYNIFGLYADARATFGKFSARAGVRYEYSLLQADFLTGEQDDFHANLNDVVPNASVAWKASDASMWKLSYNRKIERPGISYLNPAITVYPNAITFGNPNLKSSVNDYITFNYSLSKPKFYLDLSLTYSSSNNGIGSFKWTDDQNVTYSTYDNFTHYRQATLALFLQWQITNKTSWMVNANMNYKKYSILMDNTVTKLSRPNGFYYIRLQQKLPWDLTLSLSSQYFSGSCNSVYAYSTREASAIGYSISLQRSFLKNKTLDINISLDNLGIKDYKAVTHYFNGGRYGTEIRIDHCNQGITVGVNWRFGNLRAQMKKTGKTIDNDDLQGRKNN